MLFEEYLRYRFLRNNHNKYAKYVQEWIDNLLPEQLEYLKLEQTRLALD